jgi:hypothetical protein
MCLAPRPDMSGLSALFDLSTLSGLAVGFQRLWSDMSGLSVLSGLPVGFQRRWPDMSGPQLGHVWVSDTPTTIFSLGAIKYPPCLSSTVGHSFHIVNTLKHSLELPASLLQALYRRSLYVCYRDLRLTFEWPTRSSSQALYRRSLYVCYSWGFVPLDKVGCPWVTKVVVDPRKCVLPSALWGFDSGNRTRFWWSFEVD